MDLITHNAPVTPAELEHSHRITYSLDLLERDAKIQISSQKNIWKDVTSLDNNFLAHAPVYF